MALMEKQIEHLIARYRIPEAVAHCCSETDLGDVLGFFEFGPDVICYGRCPSVRVSGSSSAPLNNAWDECAPECNRPCLPFDPDEVVENLLCERAFASDDHLSVDGLVRSLYYYLRPRIPEKMRKQLQLRYMAANNKAKFPKWPIDWSVERVLEKVLAIAMRTQGLKSVPFVWFWPDGCSCAVTLTHDVETVRGRDFCKQLMYLDESGGFRSSFQLVPEQRYSIPSELIASMRDRGFEVNIHDLNHDGRLYSNRGEYLRRVKAINQYGKLMMARGFRSGAMYRDLRWYSALDFEYDMSVPNVGRWEAQKGGCCTVMPYFIGSLLEIPLTTLQDYILFELWKDYSIEIWKSQARLIRGKNGLIHFLIHPDYIIHQRAQSAYRELLDFLRDFRVRENVWCALPGEVNDWWRQRANMSLVADGQGGWRIEGAGSERARLAYADLSGHKIVYRIHHESTETTTHQISI